MRFFTSLIVLVPLVFSVVALPASTQDVSAIISGIKDLTAQLTTVENVLQNLTQANVAKIASVSQLKFTLRSILPILIPFHV
jgi:hypothetical protein